MLKKILIAGFCLFVSIKPAFCQQKQAPGISRNTGYVDFLVSNRAFYSVNYDRIFRHGEKVNYSYRVGFSVLDNAMAMPVGINLFTGKGNSHAEFSLTVIPYVDKDRTFLSKNDLSDKYIYVVPGVGYRYQKWTGGFFFKIVASPLIFLDPPSDDFWNMDPKLFAAGNIGVGISF